MSITKQETWNLIFKRKGTSSNFTKPFEQFDQSIQSIFLSKIKLNESEIPVIGYYHDDNQWLLITTSRIVYIFNDEVLSIENDSIDSVVPYQFGTKYKSEMQELKIINKLGIESVIKIESGLPFFGIWNIIRNICIRNE